MKIAVFHNLPVGGAMRSVYEEVKYLSKYHEVHSFTLGDQKALFNIKPLVKRNRLYDFKIDSGNSLFPKRLKNDFNNFYTLSLLHKRIASDIDSDNFDVCIAHPDVYTQAPFLLKYLKTPSVYYCHEWLRLVYEDILRFNDPVIFPKKIYENSVRLLRKIIDKDNANSADYILTNSKFTKRNADTVYNVRSEVCYVGVDTVIFSSTGGKSKYVLFIGEEHDLNGFNLVSEVMKILKDRGINIQLKSFGFRNKKPVSDKQLAELYSKAIATFCTSVNEPFGLVPLESMACETPVLVVNEGGYKETVEGGVTGFLLPREPKAFAEKIQYLLKNPDVVEKMGKMGRGHVKKYFTWEKHNKILENILLKVVKMSSK